MKWLSVRSAQCFAAVCLCVWLATSAGNATADQPLKKTVCEADCVAIGEWRFSVGVGLGARLNPLVEGADAPLLVLPEVSYYGRRFFLRNLDLGFTLLETPRHQLNLLVTPSYDQMYFNRWDPLNFTSAGGASSSLSPISSPPAPDYTRINVRGRAYHGNAGGETPIPPEDSSDSPDSPGDIIDPSDPPQEDISFSGRISSTPLVIINGSVVTASGSISGAEGNTINILIGADEVSIDGLSGSDDLSLRSESSLELSDLEGDAVFVTAGTGSASTVNVNARTNGFVIDPVEDGGQGAGSDAPATAAPDVAYDAVRKRRLSGLAGVEYSYTSSWMSVHVQALQDITSVHEGQELRLALVLPLDLATQKVAFTLGANHKSQSVLDYYYGIDEAEAQDDSWLYQPAAGGTETLVRLDWQKPISRGWSLRAKLQYLNLPSTMTRSPLVEKDYVFSAFFGGVYHF